MHPFVFMHPFVLSFPNYRQSIFCREGAHVIGMERDVVFLVNIIGVSTHLLAVKAYCHVHPLVVIIVVVIVKIMRLPATQNTIQLVFPFPTSHFHFAIHIEIDGCTAGREDYAATIVVFVVQDVVLVKSPLLAVGRDGNFLLHNEQVEPLLAVANICVVGEKPCFLAVHFP